MKPLHLALLILAFLLLMMSAVGVQHPRHNFLAWGLAIYVLAVLSSPWF